jgi:hypothetical protein
MAEKIQGNSLSVFLCRKIKMLFYIIKIPQPLFCMETNPDICVEQKENCVME